MQKKMFKQFLSNLFFFLSFCIFAIEQSHLHLWLLVTNLPHIYSYYKVIMKFKLTLLCYAALLFLKSTISLCKLCFFLVIFIYLFHQNVIPSLLTSFRTAWPEDPQRHTMNSYPHFDFLFYHFK